MCRGCDEPGHGHRLIEHLKTFPDLGKTFDDETWAEVMLVFRHKPGVEGLEHSFVVTDVRELGYAYVWATRTRIGDFVGVYPLPKHMTCDPHQLLLYSNTMEGRGKRYHARMELKRLLPPNLRPLVSKHRRAGRTTKVEYLAKQLPCNNMKPFVLDATSTVDSTHKIQSASTGAIVDWLKTGVELPDWYKSRTKMDLWAEDLKARQPNLYAQLAYWMGDARNFYRAVTGQIDPNEVESLFVRLPKTAVKSKQVQMALF